MAGIKIHHTETQEGAWDATANVARLRSGEDQSYYERMYAWRDPDGDPTTKGAYKFPHHVVSGDGEPGAAVVRGCQAGIAVLNGSMGGADIPDADRQGVYRHLAAHLEDADVEPAELREIPRLPSVARNDGKGASLARNDGVERRFVTSEVRVVDVDGEPHIRGYGAVFNEWSEDLGNFREMVEPGAFNKTLQEADVRSLYNHDPNYVLGRSSNGTLRLFVDERGLGYDVVPPDTQWARDLMVSIRREDVNQASFGFRVVRDKWSQDEEGGVRRSLVEVELYDLGPVTFPAYPQTSAEARARVDELRATPGDMPGLSESEGNAPGQVPHPDPSESGAADGARARLGILRRKLDLEASYFVGGD